MLLEFPFEKILSSHLWGGERLRRDEQKRNRFPMQMCFLRPKNIRFHYIFEFQVIDLHQITRINLFTWFVKYQAVLMQKNTKNSS